MVIRYVPTGNSDELGCGALVDIASASAEPVVVGAWMTRGWMLLSGASGMPRVTNDVDVAAQPEIRSSGFGTALIGLGYVRDELGYPFRYTLQTKKGARIVDVMRDAGAEADEPAFPVFGLDAGTSELVKLNVEITGIGSAAVRLPTLDGAFLLRSLALSEGAAGLKFPDYARDAATIGRLLLADPDSLVRWRARVGDSIEQAREIVVPLFSTSTGPGPLAVAQRASGDRDLAARQSSATINELFAQDGRR